MSSARRIFALLLFAVAPLTLAQQAPRKAVKTASDLPAFSYPIVGSQDGLIRSEDAFRPLAEKLRRDVESLLRDYAIEDRTTLRELHSTLLTLDLLENRTEEARKEVSIVRDLEDKPERKLMSVLFQEALLDSGWPKRDPQEFLRRFSDALNRLPWDVVGDRIKALKTNLERRPPASQNPTVDTPNAPEVQKNLNVDLFTARTLANSRYQLAVETPLKDEAIEAFAAYITAHKDAPPKPDIWPARSVTLDAAAKAKPVVIGIWDSGVDRSLFRNRLATDGPVPGIDLYGNPTEGELAPLEDARGYAHGTHVAGIAMEGNPFGRLVVARLGGFPGPLPWRVTPPPPTLSGIKKFAAGLSPLTAYLRKQGARVVNMSWSGFYDRPGATFEQMLQANGIGADAAERRRMAQEMRVAVRDGVRAALSSTPEILYVAAAGNDNGDTTFNESLWAAVNNLPNLIVVGAVNHAGSQTEITNYGPAVTVYANGYQVESYIPGGKRVKMSGTSMAAPNVTNLAAKLIALDSSLTPADVMKLILNGSDLSADGRYRMINPKRSVELLQVRMR